MTVQLLLGARHAWQRAGCGHPFMTKNIDEKSLLFDASKCAAGGGGAVAAGGGGGGGGGAAAAGGGAAEEKKEEKKEEEEEEEDDVSPSLAVSKLEHRSVQAEALKKKAL